MPLPVGSCESRGGPWRNASMSSRRFNSGESYDSRDGDGTNIHHCGSATLQGFIQCMFNFSQCTMQEWPSRDFNGCPCAVLQRPGHGIFHEYAVYASSI